MDFGVRCNTGNKNSYLYVHGDMYICCKRTKKNFQIYYGSEDNFPEKHPQDPRFPVPVRVPLRFLRNHKKTMVV